MFLYSEIFYKKNKENDTTKRLKVCWGRPKIDFQAWRLNNEHPHIFLSIDED